MQLWEDDEDAFQLMKSELWLQAGEENKQISSSNLVFMLSILFRLAWNQGFSSKWLGKKNPGDLKMLFLAVALFVCWFFFFHLKNPALFLPSSHPVTQINLKNRIILVSTLNVHICKVL